MNLCVITLVMLSWCCGRLTAKPIQTGNQTDSAVAEEIKRARDALLWLQFFEYAEKNDTVEDCLSCEIEECDGDCLVKLNNILSQPLRDMKEFYRIHPLDGNLTEEVLKKMSEYRCKEKDIPEADDITNAKVTDDKAEDHVRVKRYSRLANQRWDLQRTPVLTISFLDYLQKFTPAQQEQIAAECATLWAKPSGLAFQIKPYSGATNIGISHTYIDGPYNSLGSGMSPTPYSNGYSFLKLDRAEPWKLRNSSPGQGVSLKWAMCHEMGHNLDFGHSQDRSSIMYPSAGYGLEQLSPRDVQGVVNLYGRANGKTVVGAAVQPQPVMRANPRPVFRPAPRQVQRPAPRPTFQSRQPAPRQVPAPRPVPQPAPRVAPTRVSDKRRDMEAAMRQRQKLKQKRQDKRQSSRRSNAKSRRGTVDEPQFLPRGTAPPGHVPNFPPRRSR